jgi:hypothetical protein
VPVRLRASKAPVSRQQIENEKKRVHGPAQRTSGILWKELENGVAKIIMEWPMRYFVYFAEAKSGAGNYAYFSCQQPIRSLES